MKRHYAAGVVTMAKINPIIFRLPTGLKDKYDIPEHQGIFDNDGISDLLVYQVLPEDYNAANPISKEIIKGAKSAVATITRNYYQFEATNKDQRAVPRYVLRDLLIAGGNLSLYGITTTITDCSEPLIAVEDYHELDQHEDELQGYTLRVGIMNVESLKGSYRAMGTNRNYNKGCRVIFNHTHKIINGNLVNYLPGY